MDHYSHLQFEALRPELSAYLDGELDDAGIRRVEELLAADPQARAELQLLERTWDLLDELPRTEVDESFTQSTVAMVALAAAKDVEHEKQAAPQRRRRELLIGLGGMLAASLLTFFGVRAFWPDPDGQLLRDLTVLQNLDEYRQAGDIEFLRIMHREQVFPEDASDGN